MNNLRTYLLCLLLTGCTYYENEPVKPPVVEKSDPTTTLEAKHVTTPPNKITASYWKTADYLPLTAQNQVTGQVQAADGLFNMSGTFGGLTSYNSGKDPRVKMQAAYTTDSLYILVTWMDTLYNASNGNWIYDGPSDPNKAGSTTGWTSQRADDNFLISFDMGSSKRDIWNWSMALSEPLGYAIDMIDNGSGASTDAGNVTYVRNEATPGDNRSGPMYEWNEITQTLSRKPAGPTTLDPGFYLLNKRALTGDIVNGDVVYQTHCAECHGIKADGVPLGTESGPPLNSPGQFTKKTFSEFDTYVKSGSHFGNGYYPAGATDQTNLFARMKGFSGIPGYYLQNPAGSSSDIRAMSNAVIANLPKYNKKYQVLLIRALNTNQSDDIILNPATVTYSFNFSVRDNDLINRVGSNNQTLTFKP